MSYLESGEILSVISLFTYSCRGVQPAEVQKPQVLTSVRVCLGTTNYDGSPRFNKMKTV